MSSTNNVRSYLPWRGRPPTDPDYGVEEGEPPLPSSAGLPT
jgi:hypothetical protein